jgi:hypothetical protein
MAGASLRLFAACLIIAAVSAADATDAMELMRRLEQRLDEQAAVIAGQAAEIAGQAAEMGALRAKVASLEGGTLRNQTVTASVDSVGHMGMTVGRRLTHENPDHSCCRWTPDSTCGTVEATKYRQCSFLYEYLEEKTTSYDFENIEHSTCLGPTSSEWKWAYDGHVGHTKLSKNSGGTQVANIKTPLRVTLAQDCTAAPTLTVQMDTVMSGTLNVDGIDVAARLRKLGPFQDPNAWVLTTHFWYQIETGYYLPTIMRSPSSPSSSYIFAGSTKDPISYMNALRPPATITSAHVWYCLSPTKDACDYSDSFVFWLSAASGSRDIRTVCPPAYEGNGLASGEIFHSDLVSRSGAGSTAPPDDGFFAQNGVPGDTYTMEIVGSSITFSSNRANKLPNNTPFRTCAVPASTYFYGVINTYMPGQQVAIPWIKYD